MTFHLITEAADELMRHIENQNGRTTDSFLKRGIGDQISRQCNVWQVLDVLMEVID